MPEQNPFAAIDPQAGATSPEPAEDNPFSVFPKVAPEQTSGLGSFFSHAASGVLPSFGGMAAAGTGAEAGAAIGALTSPLTGPVGPLVGGLVGGLGGFWAGAAVTQGVQDFAVHQLPDSLQDTLGQSDRMKRLQEQQHPYASFLGGIAPYALTMSPGAWSTKAAGLPADATAWQRIAANPLTSRLAGGAMMGGLEGLDEWRAGESPDWVKLAVSTGFGVVFNKPTTFGEYLTHTGAAPMQRVLATLHPTEPTVAQAGDLGVIGPCITESTFHGGTEQSPAAKTSVQNAAADEQAALGTSPAADTDTIARRMHPELFAENDRLTSLRDSLKRYADEQSNPPDHLFDELDAKKSEVETALEAANPRSPDAKNYRAQLADIEQQRTELQSRRDSYGTDGYVQPADVLLARQHLADTEHALWDMAPDVAAARRRAADHAGQIEEPAAAETVAATESPKTEPVSAPPKAEAAPRSVEQQRAFITEDSTARQMAAGISREQAEANAHVEADYYETLAHRFKGNLGTAEDIYRQRAARVVGPNGQGLPPTSTPRPRPIAKIQADEKVSARKAVEIQKAEAAPVRVLETVGAEAPARAGLPWAIEGERPRIPDANEMKDAGIAPGKFKAVQEEAIGKLSDWQAAHPEERMRRGAAPAPAPVREAPAAAVPAQRPRLRTAKEIMDQDKVGPTKVEAIQEQELEALSNWQRANAAPRATKPKRNHALDLAAHNAGVEPAATPEATAAAIVDALPAEKVIEEIRAEAEAGAIEFREAEKEAAEIIPEVKSDPDAFYDADQSRSLEELESEHRPADDVAATEQRPGGGGEHAVAAEREGQVSEGGGSPGHVDGAGEGVAGEGDAADAGRDAVAAVDGRSDGDSGATAGTGGGDVARPSDAHGNPIFKQGERVAIAEGQLEARIKKTPAGTPEPEPTRGFGLQRFRGEPSLQFSGNDLHQSAQGVITIHPGDVRSTIRLARTADASTFLHETAHDWLKNLLQDSQHPLAPDDLRTDAATVRKWLKRGNDWTGFKPDGRVDAVPHEKFARTFEQYLREGVAPSPGLASVFAKFKTWLTQIYRTIKGLGAPINEDIRGVFDRMLAIEPNRTVHAPERERQTSLAAIHTADAAETEPHEAEAVGDRVVAERDGQIVKHPPEIASELRTAEPVAKPAADEPADETGEGTAGSGEVDRDSGQPEPIAPGGSDSAGRRDIEQGRGAPVSKGDGLGASAAVGGDRSGPRESAGPNALAPKPAGTFRDDADPKLVDLAGNIRVENLTDVESVAQAIHDSAERNDEFQAVRGGMTKGQMLDLADAMGLDPAKITEEGLSRLFGGTQDLGAKILAARKLVVQSAETVSNMMKVAASGTDHDVAALGVAIARHDMIQSALAGVTAEWGRAGNAFHSLLGGWNKAQDVNQLLKDNLGRDLFQLKMIAKLGARMDTPGKVSKLLRDAKERSFGRMILEYWINGLISGPSTHVTYMVGNAVLAAEKAGPETAIAAALGAMRARAGRTGERVRLGEVAAQFKAAGHELPAAVQAALESYRSGVTTMLPGEDARALMPFQGDMALTVSKGMTNDHVTWKEVRADAYSLIQGMRDGLVASGELIKAGGVPGASTFGTLYTPGAQIPDIAYKGVNVMPLGTLARLPSRNVAAIHSTFRALNYSMEINALAYRQAAEEGLAGGALDARVADLRQNPPPEMMERARGKATDLTLMGEGGALVNALSKLVNTDVNLPILGKTPILKFVDPFVHIAANIMNQSLVQRTPLGLLSSEVRADLMGKNGNVAADTAAAKMLVGSALSIMFGGLAAQGLASGSGPVDPNKAAMWRLAGNQAHSVRVGDIWYDVHRLGPLGMLMSVAADMYDVAHQMGTEDADVVGKSLLHAFSQNILDESFMRGPSDLIRAVTESDRYGASYVRTTLSSFVPYSVGMAQMARAADPYSRQARTIMDAIRAKVPGMSESLFPRRDIWGEPMASGDALGAPGLTAIYERKMSTDPVNLTMLNLGIAPAPVERSIRNVKLTDAQYDEFARIAGRSTKMRLDQIVRNPDFQTWPAATKHEVIEETLRQSREAARGMMMMKYPEIPREAAQMQISRKTGEPTAIH